MFSWDMNQLVPERSLAFVDLELTNCLGLSLCFRCVCQKHKACCTQALTNFLCLNSDDPEILIGVRSTLNIELEFCLAMNNAKGMDQNLVHSPISFS
ncbi:hypothetical protein VNO80_07320 [Phaseolus coccineus]|uniref:Uncharacterized protein n=1 Tax=Phaseolus coccineus TaxID=3886 RepID=A0AAN9NJY8_PHACN